MTAVLGETWVLARRELTHWRQQPAGVIVNWLFTVMIALMFGGLFGGAIGEDYFDYLMPGMFALTMFFGVESTMTAVSTDAAKGVTDRFRSLPINSASVVLGRCLADLMNSAVGLVVLVGAAAALGWRWHEGLGRALAAFGLLLLLRFALLWVGIFLGLVVKGPESVTMVQILVWPVGFLSGVFVDPATMPSWLGAIAQWNPLSATAAASRDLFGNPGLVPDHAMLLAVLWPLLLTAIFLPLSVHRHRRLGS
ncbi:ABC transporter permease [Catellatospora citrea]|uniref:Transport permease protein n=1 Tax=Catellatospora citrea TaxID=53366 RepID=A0A8J3KNY7_9ACTN|nr:ABC transporter permease [Catellatospora citrea]RKE06162.1 ABC-2 type transport system permease protein [Catellatospora citrea]GIG00501.1 transport permease protein [Catellatospora citrea]